MVPQKGGKMSYIKEIKLAIWKVVVGGCILAALTSIGTYVIVGVAESKVLRSDYNNHIKVSEPLIAEHKKAMEFITTNTASIERIPQMDSLLRVVVYELQTIRSIMERRR